MFSDDKKYGRHDNLSEIESKILCNELIYLFLNNILTCWLISFVLG
jgi:hypothetical protein